MRRFLPSNGKLIWTAIITSMAGTLISSGVALKALQATIQPVSRPDPFYGEDGRKLQAQLDALNVRVARLEAK